MASSPPAARCPTLLLLLMVCAEAVTAADRASEQQQGAKGRAETPTTAPAPEKDLLARWPSASETLITGGVFAAVFATVHLTPLGVPVIVHLASSGYLGAAAVGMPEGYLIIHAATHAASLTAACVSGTFFLGARIVEAPYFEALDAAAVPALPAHNATEAAGLRRRLDEVMAESGRYQRQAAASLEAVQAQLQEAEARRQQAEAKQALWASREAAKVAAARASGGEEAAATVRRLEAEAAELKDALVAAEAQQEMAQEALAEAREAQAQLKAELHNERLHQWQAEAAEAAPAVSVWTAAKVASARAGDTCAAWGAAALVLAPLAAVVAAAFACALVWLRVQQQLSEMRSEMTAQVSAPASKTALDERSAEIAVEPAEFKQTLVSEKSRVAELESTIAELREQNDAAGVMVSEKLDAGWQRLAPAVAGHESLLATCDGDTDVSKLCAPENDCDETVIVCSGGQRQRASTLPVVRSGSQHTLQQCAPITGSAA